MIDRVIDSEDPGGYRKVSAAAADREHSVQLCAHAPDDRVELQHRPVRALPAEKAQFAALRERLRVLAGEHRKQRRPSLRRSRPSGASARSRRSSSSRSRVELVGAEGANFALACWSLYVRVDVRERERREEGGDTRDTAHSCPGARPRSAYPRPSKATGRTAAGSTRRAVAQALVYRRTGG